jgi:hypothetical protein
VKKEWRNRSIGVERSTYGACAAFDSTQNGEESCLLSQAPQGQGFLSIYVLALALFGPQPIEKRWKLCY